MDFSVLISVYFKEKVEFLEKALDSILNNSLQPSQIILVKDGKLTKELDECIEIYCTKYSDLFTIVSLDANVGLGKALNAGLKHALYDIIARMDTDDICYQDRFKKQIEFLIKNPSISVIGTGIQEFNLIPGDLNQFRNLPVNSEDLLKFSKFRNPLNHPTVMFRKKAVIEAGSYQDMPLFEDYYLWVRMLHKGFKIANISEPLLHFRIGNNMIGRRSGWSYLKKELAFLSKIREINYINRKEFLVSGIVKLPLRILPKSILTFLYKKLLR
ncbi:MULTISPECIES: glycosyltransferase [Chryseobacterium]|uniref:glycosyltransferase n=1 Tax=Chryseobacterium TaxID=59732 RepID=UPI001294931B|nr:MULTISPECIES: glycosyltransferase [Chryseobacterium]MDR6923465.1 glycosyltransferase involved in cell wall biosynthesis [Chryseobacterium sp. 2987]